MLCLVYQSDVVHHVEWNWIDQWIMCGYLMFELRYNGM
jgi:hypothetical protein